jgi:uncharacterized RDD family membrane protein YckC
MKSIDIRTTQNVTISYELASVRDRILGFVLDSIFKTILLLILYWLFLALFNYRTENYFELIVVLPVSTFYTLVFEVLWNGQTPGKRLLKIKVIKLDGKQPGFYDYLIRWTFRILDCALSVGIVGVILIISTEYAQRLGDLTSNTTVVRVDGRLAITLKDILRIDSRQSYVPRYPQISQFREEDILLIKLTIDRYQKHENDAHKKAILLLCEKICKQLGIDIGSEDKVIFLKTLIKDYIVLTR